MFVRAPKGASSCSACDDGMPGDARPPPAVCYCATNTKDFPLYTHTHKVIVVVKPEALINSHCCFKENTLTFCLTVQTYRPGRDLGLVASADEAENTHWEAK